jgi:hypothetical protein
LPPWRHLAQAEMVISQSGPDLVLSFPAAPEWTLRGAIQGEAVTAAGAGSDDNATGGPTATGTNLDMILDWQAHPDRLTGVLRFAGCPVVLRFVATRQSGELAGAR